MPAQAGIVHVQRFALKELGAASAAFGGARIAIRGDAIARSTGRAGGLR
jgi:hypothetical protein